MFTVVVRVSMPIIELQDPTEEGAEPLVIDDGFRSFRDALTIALPESIAGHIAQHAKKVIVSANGRYTLRPQALHLRDLDALLISMQEDQPYQSLDEDRWWTYMDIQCLGGTAVFIVHLDQLPPAPIEEGPENTIIFEEMA